MLTAATQPNALKRVLFFDAAASGAMGLLFVIAAQTLGGMLGLPVNLLRSIGVFLVPFAAVLVWLATRRQTIPGVTLSIVFGNVLWVIASVALLVSGLVRPTMLGEVFVLAQAVAVLVFASLEYWGLRRTRQALVTERA